MEDGERVMEDGERGLNTNAGRVLITDGEAR